MALRPLDGFDECVAVRAEQPFRIAINAERFTPETARAPPEGS